MKKHDLQPTDDNIRSTFYNDSIGRNKDLVNFIKIIDSIDESYSIALDSYWGSGKTFFVKQVKMILDTITENSYGKVNGQNIILSKWDIISQNLQIKKHVPIYYDAWANDCDEDPIYSLIYQMTLDTENIEGLKDQINFNDVLSIAGKITGAIAGFDPNDIADALKKGDFLDQLRERKDIYKRIKEYIDTLLPEGCDRLLIIVDELDRCNPEFAVKLLERIKHYFNNDKVTFVFSVNLAELQHTIKHHYGADFNASRYLDRLFELRVPLTKLNAELLLKNADYSTMDCIDYDIVIAVYYYFNMQIRDYLKYISVLKRYVKPIPCGMSELNNTYEIIENVLLPFSWGLMMNDSQKYHAFISGKDNSELINFLLYPKVFKKSKQYIKNVIGKAVETIPIEGKIELNAKMDYELLYKFYDSFFNSSSEDLIKECKIRNYEREFFHSTVAQMSKYILIDEQE